MAKLRRKTRKSVPGTTAHGRRMATRARARSTANWVVFFLLRRRRLNSRETKTFSP